jgi:hypothetical protein
MTDIKTFLFSQLMEEKPALGGPWTNTGKLRCLDVQVPL